MKIATTQPIDPPTLMAQLQQAMPQYKFSKRTSKLIVAEKTSAIGANVLVGKNKITVAGNFPNMGLQMVFILAIVFLGVLIPLLIYFIAIYGKQKAAAEEVGATIQAMLGQGAGQAVAQPYGQPQGYGQPQPGYAQQPQYAPQGQLAAGGQQYGQPQPGYAPAQPQYPGTPPGSY